jgi:hypothetical protein
MTKTAQGKSRNTTARRKSCNTKKKGARDHFTGSKLAFLVSWSEKFQEASDSDTVSSFYTKVTADFVKNFGLGEPFHKEPTNDSPPDPTTPRPLLENTSALFTKLRTVS